MSFSMMVIKGLSEEQIKNIQKACDEHEIEPKAPTPSVESSNRPRPIKCASKIAALLHRRKEEKKKLRNKRKYKRNKDIYT